MEQNLNKKQNHRVTIFAVILSALSIGLLVFGFFMVSSDKVVMLQSISNLKEKLNHSILDENVELLNMIAKNDDVGFQSTIDVESSLLGFDGSVTFDYLENKKDQQSKANFGVKVNEEELISGNLALKDQNVYLFVKDLTPRYYYTAMQYMALFSKLNSDDYENLLDLVKNSITNPIDSQNITKKKVTISYKGKEKKVNQLSYEITKQSIENVFEEFIHSIKKDKKLLEKLSSLSGTSNEEFISELESAMSLITSNIQDSYYYRVYYYGFNRIVGYELEAKDGSSKIQYKIDDKETIELYSNHSLICSLEINKDNNGYSYNGVVVVDGENVQYHGNYQDNQFTFIVEGEQDIEVVVKTTDSKKENRYHEMIDIVGSVITGGEKTEVIQVSMSMEYSFGEKVNISLDNSTSIHDITEEDMNQIMVNLENHPLYQIVESFISELGLDL